jgi:predicted HicB family RNase H-like nuclease
MKYLKTFENYEVNSELKDICDQFNINSENIERAINQKFDTLSEDQKDKVTEDMLELSKKLGLTMEEMTDQTLVYNAIKNLKSVNLLDFQKNENAFTDFVRWVKQAKAKILKIIGISGLLLSVITLGMGANIDEMNAKKVRIGDDIEPSKQTVIGGVSAVISLAICVLAISIEQREKQKKYSKK